MRNHRSFTETLRIRRRYHHSYAISKLRAGVSAGLGGFVAFRQLPSRPDECDRLAKIDWANVNERLTRVTAKNLRSRRPSFWPAHEVHAPLARNWKWGAEGLPHARASRGEAVRGQSSIKNFQQIAGRAGGDGNSEARTGAGDDGKQRCPNGVGHEGKWSIRGSNS